ncbi:MAG TPA: M10 family metallopeptidase C-terminal domain-containing protein [Caulobacteraceae bacterium]
MGELSGLDAGYLSLDGSDQEKIEARQGEIVAHTGMNGKLLENLDNLSGLEVLWLNSIFGFSNYTTSKVRPFVEAGGSLFLSAPGDGFAVQPSNHAHGPEEINLVDGSGPLASGPAGTLDDGDLDNAASHTGGLTSHRAFYRLEFVQDLEVAYLLTEDDPAAGVAALATVGRGYSLETTIPLGLFFESGEVDAAYDAALDAFSANALAYAASLRTLTETDLTDGADVYTAGGAGEDVLAGGGGDRVTGGGGADIVHAGAGADRVAAGAGADIAWGGAGNDRLDGGLGDDQLWGGAGADLVRGQGAQDFLVGGSGGDTVLGGGGADTLLGADGDDQLRGGGGNDVLAGGTGRDTLLGGAGADRFMFMNEYPWWNSSHRERIGDFSRGEDVIDLSAGGGFAFVDQFHGGSAEIVLADFDGGSRVLIDSDGDGEADWTIVVVTADGAGLDQGDFIVA